MTEQTADSLLMGGASFFSWATKNELGQFVTKPYGTSVAGTVAAIGEPQQQTDWDTGALMTWTDGKPRMQFAITLDVDWQGSQLGVEDLPSDNSDTQRSVMIKQSSQIQAALRDAIKSAGGSGLQLGAYVKFTLTGEQPSQKGNPLKVYAVEYRLPAQGMVMDGGQQAQSAQAPQQAQVPPQNVPQQAPQGNAQDPVAIAKKLLHELHLPPEQVAASTGLTPEQVQGLANQGSGQTPPPF